MAENVKNYKYNNLDIERQLKMQEHYYQNRMQHPHGGPPPGHRADGYGGQGMHGMHGKGMHGTQGPPGGQNGFPTQWGLIGFDDAPGLGDAWRQYQGQPGPGCGCGCPPEPYGDRPPPPPPWQGPGQPPKPPENSEVKIPSGTQTTTPTETTDKVTETEEKQETKQEATQKTKTPEQQAFETVDKHFEAIDNAAGKNVLGNDRRFVKEDLEAFLKKNPGLPEQEQKDIQFVIDNFGSYADGNTLLYGQSISKEQVDAKTTEKADSPQQQQRIDEERKFTANTMSPIDNAYLNEIKALRNEGDTCIVGAGGGVSAYGGHVEAGAEVEITYNGEGKGYTVRVGGEVGAGVDEGTKAGVWGYDAKATLNLGGSREYTFETPEAAAKAAGILSAEVAGTAASSSLPGLGFIANGARAAYSTLSGEQEFLASRLSAVELDVGIAAELCGDVSLAKLGLDGSGSVSARIEFEDGKPSALVLKGETSLELQGGVGLYIGDEDGFSIDGLNGSINGSLSTEHRFPLNADSLKGFSENPLEALKGVVDFENSEVSIKASYGYNTQAIVSGGMPSKQTELELTGKHSELFTQDILLSLARGDLGKTADILGDKVTVQMTTADVTTSGFDVNPGLKASGFGVDMQLKAQGITYENVVEKEATLREILDALYTPGQSSKDYTINVPIIGI